MRKKSSYYFLLLFLTLLFFLSLSKENTEYIRNGFASLLYSPWNSLTDYKLSFNNFFSRFSFDTPSNNAILQEMQKLQLKNIRLETELKTFQTLLGEDLAEFFELKLDCIPAKVIFRTYNTWNSALWLNVGSDDNLSMGTEIIAKNSPVVIGTSIIGVVEFVAKKCSRVRLITDSGLRPSVRVKRAYGAKSYLLAKGEIFGSSQPYWKAESLLLQGIGFNYDFPDVEGPARDLRTGKLANDFSNKPSMPLIKVGDTLVTTGLDGVFPSGLDVANVSKIYPLKEGDYYYEIEAKPTAHLYDLSYVFVIAPMASNSTQFFD